MRFIILLYILSFPLLIFSQNGGINSYSFINVEISPRIEAMGGNLISIYDNDINLALTTPSLLNQKMHNELSFSVINYVSDINLYSAIYVRDISKLGTVLIGFKSFNYGDFKLTDEIGNEYGIFNASDQVFTLSIGKQLFENLSLGCSFNLISSQYESYNAMAISSNLSTTYNSFKHNFTSTLICKNIGRSLNTYTNSKEYLPIEIQFGLSKILKHLPFRYHISYNNLNKFNISSPYKLTTQTNIETGDLEIKRETFAKTLLRHIIIGGELNPFKKNLYLRAGFNFQKRFDMSLSTYPYLTGFSFGLGFKVYRFRFDYSRSFYHVASIINNFSITTNLSKKGLL